MSMQYAKPASTRRRNKWNRMLFFAAAIVLFAGLFLQITMLSRISLQTKQVSALEDEIEELTANADNLQLSISQRYNPTTIKERAFQIGMQEFTNDQVRVISVAYDRGDTSTQTVEAIDGEKVLN